MMTTTMMMMMTLSTQEQRRGECKVFQWAPTSDPLPASPPASAAGRMFSKSPILDEDDDDDDKVDDDDDDEEGALSGVSLKRK